MSDADYALLRRFRAVFEVVPYYHRNSSIGDRVAQFIYEDLYTLGKSLNLKTRIDPELRAHQEWRGYLQPAGLVVSPAALRDAQAFVNKNIVREQSETTICLKALLRALRQRQQTGCRIGA